MTKMYLLQEKSNSQNQLLKSRDQTIRFLLDRRFLEHHFYMEVTIMDFDAILYNYERVVLYLYCQSNDITFSNHIDWQLGTLARIHLQTKFMKQNVRNTRMLEEMSVQSTPMIVSFIKGKLVNILTALSTIMQDGKLIENQLMAHGLIRYNNHLLPYEDVSTRNRAGLQYKLTNCLLFNIRPFHIKTLLHSVWPPFQTSSIKSSVLRRTHPQNSLFGFVYRLPSDSFNFFFFLGNNRTNPKRHNALYKCLISRELCIGICTDGALQW